VLLLLGCLVWWRWAEEEEDASLLSSLLEE
jgi:hypothetical protein